MLEISGKTNLLEQNAYKYSLQDVAEPNLQRDIYTQGAVPKVPFTLSIATWWSLRRTVMTELFP